MKNSKKYKEKKEEKVEKCARKERENVLITINEMGERQEKKLK